MAILFPEVTGFGTLGHTRKGRPSPSVDFLFKQGNQYLDAQTRHRIKDSGMDSKMGSRHTKLWGENHLDIMIHFAPKYGKVKVNGRVSNMVLVIFQFEAKDDGQACLRQCTRVHKMPIPDRAILPASNRICFPSLLSSAKIKSSHLCALMCTMLPAVSCFSYLPWSLALAGV